MIYVPFSQNREYFLQELLYRARSFFPLWKPLSPHCCFIVSIAKIPNTKKTFTHNITLLIVSPYYGLHHDFFLTFLLRLRSRDLVIET